jgi:hypothetical protein
MNASMATAAGPETWAVKYGAMANGRFGNKSGFSPTGYIYPTLEQGLHPNIQQIEGFQRDQFYGFTSRELGQLDCLPTRELIPANLQNDIIPMLRRENWERTPAQPDFTRDYLYPLKNGRGVWSADNDEVWNVMEPIVKLASRMLMSIHVMPWVCFLPSWHICTDQHASLMLCSTENEDLSHITDCTLVI